MKYFIIAGEASGDLHASHVVKEIYAIDKQAKIIGWGGDYMQQAGVEIKKHIKELSFMGFVEVLKNIFSIFRHFKEAKKQILAFHPDVLLFVDYPGFNLRMAKWAKLSGFKTAYYISPKAWAWKENRVHAIHQYIDEMLCILPFEKQFYAKWNYPIRYVGNPTAEEITKERLIPSIIASSNNSINEPPFCEFIFEFFVVLFVEHPFAICFSGVAFVRNFFKHFGHTYFFLPFSLISFTCILTILAFTILAFALAFAILVFAILVFALVFVFAFAFPRCNRSLNFCV